MTASTAKIFPENRSWTAVVQLILKKAALIEVGTHYRLGESTRSWCLKNQTVLKQKISLRGRLKDGKRPTSHRYNHIPLLRSHPGGFYRSWSCRTCQCKDTIFLYFCKWFV